MYVTLQAITFCTNYKDMQIPTLTLKSQNKYWIPLEAKWLKFNVDGAIFPEQSKAGVGCVTRDNQGKVIMVASKLETLSDDQLEVELQAIFQGMQLCLLMGVRKIVVETDYLVAVQVLDVWPDSFVCYYHLLREILSLEVCFKECVFSYVSQLGNRVAQYLLARYAWNFENFSVLWESPLEFILSSRWLDSSCNT